MTGPSWKIIAQTHDRRGESPTWHPGAESFSWVDWYAPASSPPQMSGPSGTVFALETGIEGTIFDL